MRRQVTRWLAIAAIGTMLSAIPVFALSPGITFVNPTNTQTLSSVGQIKVSTALTSKGWLTISDNGAGVCVKSRSVYCNWPTTSTSKGNHTLTAAAFTDTGASNGSASILVHYTSGTAPSPTPTPAPTPTPLPSGTPTPTPKPTPTPTPGSGIAIKLIDTVAPFVGSGGSWGPDYYAFAKAALQNQANAVASTYAKGGITIYGFGETAPAGAWPIYIQSSCILGPTIYAGYHWYQGATPYGCIRATPSQGGGYWWMTRAMEHEMTEMVGDPFPGTRGDPEIVDDVAQYFGMVNPTSGVFTFTYIPTSFNWPFTDFDLPLLNQIKLHFKDYLKQVAY